MNLSGSHYEQISTTQLLIHCLLEGPSISFYRWCQMRLGNLCFYFTWVVVFISFAQGSQKVLETHLDFEKYVDLRETPQSNSILALPSRRRFLCFQELNW